MDNAESNLILAGDIGGTKTNLGLFAKGKNRPLLKAHEAYSSRESGDLKDIVARFLKKHPAPVSRACFGIAGPVVKGQAKTTNLPWQVDGTSMKKRFGWPTVYLLNDLVATALAIPILTARETLSLNSGKKHPGGNIGLLAPGTGLGVALLVGTKSGYAPLASEGGHVDFGPNNKGDVALWQYLRNRFGHVSEERILSGPGLVNIYQWLRDSGRYREPLWLKQRLAEIDPAQAITEAALKRNTPLALATLKTFASLLGSAAGNLALTGTTTGGMFLGGGILPKILPQFDGTIFNDAFVSKGRFRSFLESIPVQVVLNDKAALMGAAVHALSE